MQVVFVIPVYNEQETLEPLAEGIIGHMGDRPHRIIFVNDGSTDETAALADRPIGGLGVHLIRRVTDLPIAIGFGVRSPAQAAEAVRAADGAVVASALIDTLAHSLDVRGRPGPDSVRRVLDQVRALAEGVRAARATI